MTTETNETHVVQKVYFSYADGAKSAVYPTGLESESKQPDALKGTIPETEWENFAMDVKGTLKSIHDVFKMTALLQTIAGVLLIVAIIGGVAYTILTLGFGLMTSITHWIVPTLVLFIAASIFKTCKRDACATQGLAELKNVVEQQNHAEWNENSLVKFNLKADGFGGTGVQSRQLNYIECTLSDEEC